MRTGRRVRHLKLSSFIYLLAVLTTLILHTTSCPETCSVPSPCRCDYLSLNCPSGGINNISYFKNCGGVDRIYLSDNGITILTKESFSAFPDAVYINLASNKIASIEEETFLEVPKLSQLVLEGNLIEVLPKLNLPQIKILQLSKNPISKIDGGLAAQNLETLELAGCRLSTFNSFLTRTSKLSTLNVGNNQLKELNSEWFEMAKSLTLLNMSHNQVEFLKTNGENLRNLKSLDLSYNKGLKVLDPEIFKSMPSLQTLNLEGTSLSTLSDGPVLSHSSISRLSLASCELTKELTATSFSALPNLKELDLSNNHLFGLESLFDSSHLLRKLVLSGNNLNSLSTGVFVGTPALEELYLNSNAFNSFNLSMIDHLESLRVLDVSNTPLVCDCSEDHWLLNRWTNDTGVLFKNTCGARPPCEWDNIFTTTEREVKCWDAAGYCIKGEKCCPNGECAVKCSGVAMTALSLTSIIGLGVIVMQSWR